MKSTICRYLDSLIYYLTLLYDYSIAKQPVLKILVLYTDIFTEYLDFDLNLSSNEPFMLFYTNKIIN